MSSALLIFDGDLGLSSDTIDSFKFGSNSVGGRMGDGVPNFGDTQTLID